MCSEEILRGEGGREKRRGREDIGERGKKERGKRRDTRGGRKRHVKLTIGEEYNSGRRRRGEK
ncbi:hypothetical protein [Streptococcus pyogenes]|uniref:hypothetical protein n=1 Tax=Streptococcus pyogenes TaxID=1314 RepID=UPI0011E82044|nr:hypothetical protein [Streptococcus pyogenes]TYL22954.1 hypothetical protein E0F60_09375 [Streptococcus pyogenes]